MFLCSVAFVNTFVSTWKPSGKPIFLRSLVERFFVIVMNDKIGFITTISDNKYSHRKVSFAETLNQSDHIIIAANK
jgi:hypothetical protein